MAEQVDTDSTAQRLAAFRAKEAFFAQREALFSKNRLAQFELAEAGRVLAEARRFLAFKQAAAEKASFHAEEFMRTGVFAADEVDEEEGEVAEMYTQVDPTLRFKCGITRALMIDPQRLAGCGHTFSKRGILSVLKKSQQEGAKCPKSGCNKPLKESDLILHEEMAADIARYNLELSGKKRKLDKKEGEVIDVDDEVDIL